MTTLKFVTGYEHGVATPVTSGAGLCNVKTGTPTVDVTAARTGSYGLHCNPASAAATYLSYSVLTITGLVVRVYFRFATLPSGDCYLLTGENTDARFVIYYESSNGELMYGKDGVAGSLSTGVVLQTGQWYCLDAKFISNATTHTLDLALDGTSFTQYSVNNRTSYSVTAVRVGLCSAVTADMYVDDLVFSFVPGDYPIGPGGVIGLSPDADGTHNSGTVMVNGGTQVIGVSVTAYDLLYDVPMNTALDMVRQTGSGTGNYAEVNFDDTAETDIIGATALLAYKSASTTANNGGCIALDEDATATTLWGAPGALSDYSESSLFYKNAPLPTPAGGWDQAAVNALKVRMGYSSDVSPIPHWHSLMIEVAFRPVSGQVVSQSFAGVVSTLSGALAKQDNKRVTGSTFSSGTVQKQTGKRFLEGLTSRGVLGKSLIKTLAGNVSSTGSLAAAKAVLRSFAGSLTTSGVIRNQTSKPLTGNLTPAGTVQKRTGKRFTGGIVSSGGLSALKAVTRLFAGAIGASAALQIQARKTFAGSLTSAGTLTRRIAKTLSGGLSPNGAVNGIKALVRNFAGSIGSSGARILGTQKKLAGVVTTSGVAQKQTAKRLTGTASSSGKLTGLRSFVKIFSGGVATAGHLAKRTSKSLTGAVVLGGGLRKLIQLQLSGIVELIGNAIGALIAGEVPGTNGYAESADHPTAEASTSDASAGAAGGDRRAVAGRAVDSVLYDVAIGDR